MIWAWLQSLTRVNTYGETGALPALQKAAAVEQQQQQQGHLQQQQPAEKEYCLRMAFKLTPKYSSKLQVGRIVSLCMHSSWYGATRITARLTGWNIRLCVPALIRAHILFVIQTYSPHPVTQQAVVPASSTLP
jgi:hypothetical protein